jgi:hypothetical protein
MALATPAVAAVNYDAVADFSSTQPAAGVWSYGSSDSLVSPIVFTQYNNYDTNYFGTGGPQDAGVSGAQGWYTAGSPSGLPTVLKNYSGSNMTVSTITDWSPSLLLLHPGSAGQVSIVRFTAPTAGSYTVTGEFTGLDSTSTDVHALVSVAGNVVALPGFNGAVTGFGAAQPFSFTASLAQGETIDFAVGTDGNGFNNDSTGFNATITPEPGFYGILALGIGGLALAGIRRRRQA